MKLATLKNGTRDGRLVLVSRNLRRAVDATAIAPTLLDALERWHEVEGPLQELFELLQAGVRADSFEFDPRQAMAPMPRCYQWLDGSAFANHGHLMESAFDTGVKNEYERYPLVYQGASDDFIGGTDDVLLPAETDGMDFEGEVAVVTDTVPMGTPADAMPQHVRLLMLLNDVSLRAFAPREMKTGFGWVQAKPTTAFAPVAVTPDELGNAWQGGRLMLPLRVQRNGEWFGNPHGSEMTFSFFRILEHVAYSRTLSAGTIVGSGTFSNADRAAGSACVSERRAIEMIDSGAPKTPFLKFGERVHMEILDPQGQSIFGAIDQVYRPASSR